MAPKNRNAPFVPRSSGERVAHARRLLGLHEGRDILPTDLAELVGVTVNAVYAWEAGTLPGRGNLERLAEVLRVEPAWLMFGVEPQLRGSGLADTLTPEPEPVAKPAPEKKPATKRGRSGK